MRKRGFFRNKVAVFAVCFLTFVACMVVYQRFWGGSNLASAERVVLVTSMGNITIELYADMPVTVANFKNLTNMGIYDGTIFHRVVGGFVVQGGDPTGTGMGDPSIVAIPDEFTNHNHNFRGTVAMANKGPDTGSSQFFINLVDNTQLDNDYPVFGSVVSGMDVVDEIGHVETDSNDKPVTDVTLTKVQILS
jgi:peptidylprolyl isomerase